MPAETEVPNTPEGLRRAYDAEKSGRSEAESERDRLRRENLFLRAGINTETTAGKLLINGYHGDDLEELKTMAIEVGALQASAPQPQGQQQQQVQQQQQLPQPAVQPAIVVSTQSGLPDDWEQRQEMAQLSRGGQSHGGVETPTPHPGEAALEGFFNDMKSGMDPEEAQAKALGSYLLAAAKGDPRTVFDAQAHRERALEAER